MNSYLSRRHLREPEQPEEPLRPAGGAAAAGRGRVEGPRRAGTPRQERPAADDRARSTATRAPSAASTIYQEDLRKVGITLNLRLVTPETLFKLRRWSATSTWSAWRGAALLFPNPETSVRARRWPTRTNTNNITGFKNARVDEILAAYDAEFDSAEARRAPPGARRHPRQRVPLHPRVGRAVPAHRVLEQVRPSRGLPHAHRRLPRHARRSGGSIRRRTRSCAARHGDDSVEAAGRRRPRIATGREYARARDRRQPRPRMTGVLPPPVAADHPDVHRHHAGRVRHHALRAGRPGRAADHALPDGGR